MTCRRRQPDVRTGWVDLGDGSAIDASRVRELLVRPPWPPSMIGLRAYLEQLTWTVTVVDSHSNAHHTVACYWDESGARAHARRVVDLMLTAA